MCRKESDDSSESETESSSDVATKSNSAANVQLSGERILADLVDARNLIDDLQKVYEKQEAKLQQLEYYSDVQDERKLDEFKASRLENQQTQLILTKQAFELFDSAPSIQIATLDQARESILNRMLDGSEAVVHAREHAKKKTLVLQEEEEDDLALDDSRSSVSDSAEEHFDMDVLKSKPSLDGKLQKSGRFEIGSCLSTNEGFSSKTIPGFETMEMDMAARDEVGVPLFA